MLAGEIMAALALGVAACAVGYSLMGWLGVAWTLAGMSVGVLLLAVWTLAEV